MLTDRADTYLDVVARLKDGVSLEQARTEMRLVAAQLERAYPKENAQTGAAVFLLRDQVGCRRGCCSLALVGAAVCMLLIACTNLANLLLARGAEPGAPSWRCARRSARAASGSCGRR